VLETNHPDLSGAEVVQSYRQLMEVERAFRVLKSQVKVRPVYHHRDRRVETHIFICFLAYLLAKVLEQGLRAAGLTITIAHALETLNSSRRSSTHGRSRPSSSRPPSPTPRSRPSCKRSASGSATPERHLTDRRLIRLQLEGRGEPSST
jgi:hypothetical protein